MRCSVARGPRFFKWKVLREAGPYALLLIQLLIALVTWSPVNDSASSRDIRLHVVEPPRGRSFTHPGPSSGRSRFFMESSQLCVATLTHYSTEPLTTGPVYDPLLLLFALAGDVHPNPGPSRYPCSVCFKNVTSQGTSYLCTRCSHWVHSRCSGLRNVADLYRSDGL